MQCGHINEYYVNVNICSRSKEVTVILLFCLFHFIIRLYYNNNLLLIQFTATLSVPDSVTNDDKNKLTGYFSGQIWPQIAIVRLNSHS